MCERERKRRKIKTLAPRVVPVSEAVIKNERLVYRLQAKNE